MKRTADCGTLHFRDDFHLSTPSGALSSAVARLVLVRPMRVIFLMGLCVISSGCMKSADVDPLPPVTRITLGSSKVAERSFAPENARPYDPVSGTWTTTPKSILRRFKPLLMATVMAGRARSPSALARRVPSGMLTYMQATDTSGTSLSVPAFSLVALPSFRCSSATSLPRSVSQRPKQISFSISLASRESWNDQPA